MESTVHNPKHVEHFLHELRHPIHEIAILIQQFSFQQRSNKHVKVQHDVTVEMNLYKEIKYVFKLRAETLRALTIELYLVQK